MSPAPIEGLPLAAAISAVRRELQGTLDDGAGADVRFGLGPVEIEFAVEVASEGSGEASVKVLSVLSIGGGAKLSRADTSTVKVTLQPVGRDGQPLQVAQPLRGRPGG